MKRLLPALLLASLAVNIFLGAVMATHLLRSFDGPPRHGGPPPPDVMLERMTRDLPEADAKVMREVFGKRQGQIDAGMIQIRQLPDRLRGTLLAEPFDPAALAAIWQETHTAQRQFHEQLSAAFIEAATRMSPEGRRKLAEFRPVPEGPPPRN